MNHNRDEDTPDSTLEQWIAEAKPSLDQTSQTRIAYAAGLAAASASAPNRLRQNNDSKRWRLLASHVVSAVAAGWMMFAILNFRSQQQPMEWISSSPEGTQSLASGKSPWTPRLSATSSPDILSPRTNLSKFTELFQDRATPSDLQETPAGVEPVLRARSVVF